MKIDYPFFFCAAWKGHKCENHEKCDMNPSWGFLFRIFWGYGLHFTNGRKLFSERNGYKKSMKLPFGFRVKILKRGKDK